MTDTSLPYAHNLNIGYNYDLAGVQHWISAAEMASVPCSEHWSDYANAEPVPACGFFGGAKYFDQRPGATRGSDDIAQDLEHTDHKWTEADYFILDKYYGTVSTMQLALGIGRPIGAVIDRAQARGLRMRHTVPERAGVTQMINKVHREVSFVGTVLK